MGTANFLVLKIDKEFPTVSSGFSSPNPHKSGFWTESPFSLVYLQVFLYEPRKSPSNNSSFKNQKNALWVEYQLSVYGI